MQLLIFLLSCIFFNAVCKYFPTKHCNSNKNYIVLTVGVMLMHGGIRYLLTRVQQKMRLRVVDCRRPSLGSFLSCRKCDEAVPSKKINGTGTSKNLRQKRAICDLVLTQKS